MIDRIILFKLLEGTEKAQVVDQLKRELGALPGLVELRVGLPADAASAKSWDVSCVLRFRDQTDHDSALSSSAFTACLDESLAPRSAVIKAWSFAQK